MDDDFEAAPEPEAGDLGKISALAKRLVEWKTDLRAMQEAVAEQQKRIRELEEQDLPKAMLDLGLADFSLVGGGKIELKTEYYGTIAKEKSARCFKWLEDNNHGALIKRTLQAAFPKAAKDQAEALAAWVKANCPKAKVTDKQNVHHSTLAAFIREQIAAGNLVEGSPEFELFSVYVRRYAAVTLGDGSMIGHNGGPPADDEEF